MILVVGLGNPGPRYAETRHNVGFRIVDALAAEAGVRAWRDKFQGEIALGELQGHAIGLLKPSTFMNESGRSVLGAMGFYKPKRLVVAYDELDVPFGEVRLKTEGGDAGHRGVRSIIANIGRDFVRLRFGIGRPPAEFQGGVADFVLQGFSAAERPSLDSLVARAVDALKRIVVDGVSAAMNHVNQRPKA